MGDELHYKSAEELARLIATRKLSPVEVVEAQVQRIEQAEGALNSYITLLAEEALKEAGQAERVVMAGESLGPLHGVPVAVKDIIHARGVRTTAGSRIMSDFVAQEDATVVERMRAAGAILMGKLNCHEFAFGATGTNPHYGNPCNPWDISRITGGSSGGSGAATAAGLAALTLGTDTGGSVRIPSALCGIAGLKTTFGRVSRYGVIPLSWSLDTVGPMTRTVKDAALLLGVIAGKDERDSFTSSRPVPDYVQALDGDIKGVRVGVIREYFFDGLAPEVESAVTEAIDVLERLGAELEEVSFPRIEETVAASTLILSAEGSAYHERYLRTRPQDYGADVRERFELGRMLLATDYVNAQRLRAVVSRQYAELMERVDVLVTAVCPIAAPRQGELFVDLDGEEQDVRTVLSRLTRPFNVVGAPALNLPCGFTSEGLPLGFQVAGKLLDEATVLRVGHAYEQATPWHRRRPPA